MAAFITLYWRGSSPPLASDPTRSRPGTGDPEAGPASPPAETAPPSLPDPTRSRPGTGDPEAGPASPPAEAAPPSLPLSIDRLLQEVLDDSITDLQRANLRGKYADHLVHWRAVVHNVRPVSEKDPKTELIAVVSPPSQRDHSFRDLITVVFDSSQREFLSDVVEGATIEFEGILKFNPLSDGPSVVDARLIGHEPQSSGGT